MTKSTGGHRNRQRHSRSGNAAPTRRWSAQVAERSDALDIESGIFTNASASEIAASLKRSSMSSQRRKGTPFQSAMSMLNYYINRAGRNLSKERRETLNDAKRQLRIAFGRKP